MFSHFGLACLENENQLELHGVSGSSEQSALTVLVIACTTDTLAQGESCMHDSEVKEYFRNMSLVVNYFDTKIDFEDIENPLQTALKNTMIPLSAENPTSAGLKFKQHIFKDDIGLVQVNVNEDVASTFLSLEEKSTGPAGIFTQGRTSYGSFWAEISDLEVVETRRGYHLLDLFGDIGGIFSSIYFLSYLAHSLLVGN